MACEGEFQAEQPSWVPKRKTYQLVKTNDAELSEHESTELPMSTASRPYVPYVLGSLNHLILQMSSILAYQAQILKTEQSKKTIQTCITLFLVKA